MVLFNLLFPRVLVVVTHMHCVWCCGRVYCIAPMYVNTFNRLFDAHSSNRQWNAAKRLLEQLDALISKKYVSAAPEKESTRLGADRSIDAWCSRQV